MKGKTFGILQRVGKSFMLPIALLPIAGFLLGVGSSFTNVAMLETYHLSGVIYEGGILYSLFDIMSKTGSVVFDNLPLLFAIGVAIGMAKKEKEVAGLASAIAFLIMHTTISTLISITGGVEAMAVNSTTTVLGITTLQMGVFGGIIVGLGVAALHNKFYNIRLPDVISFFGGTRFVPIISSLVFLVVGVVSFFVWPLIQALIVRFGSLVLNSGYAGTWLYGIIERALIPFGLHHVFHTPFWQTEIGGSMMIDGVLVQGAQNIFFAQLASDSTTHFAVSATRFLSGNFPFMIFGLPGAALAMYHAARPEKKKAVGGLLLSAAVTSMLTGITEPIEFTFLFVAPLMYGVHCVLSGLSFMLMHLLNVGVGITFSGGLIDLTLFGIMQGNAKTSWVWIIVVGVAYAFIYYFVFRLLIKVFNFKTPGREDDNEETKLYRRDDYTAKRYKEKGDISASIIRGLGGKGNISDVDCCATRLRITVQNPDLVSNEILKSTGASGVIAKGNGVQIVYGPKVTTIKSDLEDFIASPYTDKLCEPLADTPQAEKAEESAVPKASEPFALYAHMNGKVVPLEQVEDEVFSGGVLGDGIAVEPTDGKLFAPCDGTVENVAETGHAVSMTTEGGCEILLHIGIDTVKLNGQFFDIKAQDGQQVRKGDLLVVFDTKKIKEAGYKLTSPMIVLNTDDYGKITKTDAAEITAGEKILEVE